MNPWVCLLILACLPFAGRADDKGGRASRHWSFQAPVRPPLPAVQASGWVRNPLDVFVLARLERNHLTPAPEAERVTLLRRLFLDLIGLPPSPEESESFAEDSRPDAYERWVDRLLSSPQHGEKWGRHWLDVARYADSSGYSIDAPRSIWKYRDWVIAALNADLPFNRFVIEQLAGDLLPEATLEQKIATGFHRNTQINQEGGIDPEQFRVESVIDRVNTTGTAFLGLTIACAQCHDHKYDPISQKDYYRLLAFFNSTVEDGHGKGTPGGLLELPNENEDQPTKLQKRQAKSPTTMVMSELSTPRPTTVFVKGDFTRPGDPVSPGLPAIFAQAGDPTANGTRLHLARWLASPQNPLVSRVTVNRVWQQYFGRGLVETENDFGTQGSAPIDPALLDWLAVEFMEQNWSMKALHRLIVTSSVYRQSSRHRDSLAATDPANRFLGRQLRLRLDAEAVRDVALTASGLLNQRLGGPSVFPPQPAGVMNLGQVNREWKASSGGDRFRRGLYTFYWRATPHPALATFDAPDAFSACTRRLRSNTPLQALMLLNDEAWLEFARALASRITTEARTDQARIERGFRLCVARSPTPAEEKQLLDLLADERESFQRTPAEAATLWGRTDSAGEAPVELAAWTTVARVLLNLDETITRE